MIDRLTFVVPGRPQAKQRPRTVRAGAGVRTYTPDKTITYERLVKYFALNAATYQHWLPLDDLFQVLIRFGYPAPKKAKESRYKASRPDIDNLAKSVLDGLGQSGVIGDDSRVVRLGVEKVSEVGCEYPNGYALVVVVRTPREEVPVSLNAKSVEMKGNK